MNGGAAGTGAPWKNNYGVSREKLVYNPLKHESKEAQDAIWNA